ncbi:MAG: hypothetical protein ACXAC7_11540 [Candidatus Hodarchaeales archaeon]|jgi:phage-related tail protein
MIKTISNMPQSNRSKNNHWSLENIEEIKEAMEKKNYSLKLFKKTINESLKNIDEISESLANNLETEERRKKSKQKISEQYKKILIILNTLTGEELNSTTIENVLTEKRREEICEQLPIGRKDIQQLKELFNINQSIIYGQFEKLPFFYNQHPALIGELYDRLKK